MLLLLECNNGNITITLEGWNYYLQAVKLMMLIVRVGPSFFFSGIVSLTIPTITLVQCLARHIAISHFLRGEVSPAVGCMVVPVWECIVIVLQGQNVFRSVSEDDCLLSWSTGIATRCCQFLRTWPAWCVHHLWPGCRRFRDYCRCNIIISCPGVPFWSRGNGSAWWRLWLLLYCCNLVIVMYCTYVGPLWDKLLLYLWRWHPHLPSHRELSWTELESTPMWYSIVQ